MAFENCRFFFNSVNFYFRFYPKLAQDTLVDPGLHATVWWGLKYKTENKTIDHRQAIGSISLTAVVLAWGLISVLPTTINSLFVFKKPLYLQLKTSGTDDLSLLPLQYCSCVSILCCHCLASRQVTPTSETENVGKLGFSSRHVKTLYFKSRRKNHNAARW